MAEVCYVKGINPSGIPGDDIDPDGLNTAAGKISSRGADVRDTGADVVAEWRVLSTHYEAPEAQDLLSVMDDVETKSRQVGDDLESVATALQNFAEDVRPIKQALASARRDAVAFRSRISGNSEWDYDQDLVDENTNLVERVNGQQVLLWEAERRCANAIRALYGAEPWHAMTGENDEFGYGVDELSTEADMPWGSEVQRRDHCPKSAGVQVKRFVVDGLIVEGLWGTVEGIGQLGGAIFGIGENADEIRDGLASLIGQGSTPAGEAWLGVGRGIIMADAWAEGDYARAAGGSIFNVATFFLPFGGLAKGAGTAGKVGKFSKAAQAGARFADFIDPVSLSIRGGRLVAPTVRNLFSDVTTGLRNIEIPTFRSTTDVPPVRDIDAPTNSRPPLRDPDAPSQQPAPQPRPVEAPQPAHVGSQAGRTDAPTSGGGSSSGGGGGTSSGGGGTSSGGGGGGDAPGGSGSSSGGGNNGSPGTPGSGAVDDVVDGASGAGKGADAETGGTSGETGGGNNGSPETPGSGAVDEIADGGSGTTPDGNDTTPDGSGNAGDGGGTGTGNDGPPSSSGDAPAPGRVAIDNTGQPHVINMRDDLIAGQPRFQDNLAETLAARGMSRSEFTELMQKPVVDLTRPEIDALLEIRHSLPPVSPDDVLQKIIPPEQAGVILGNDLPRFAEESIVARAATEAGEFQNFGGFVARGADVQGLTPAQLFDDLGLRYSDSPDISTPFVRDGESMFGIRYRAGDADTWIRDAPPGAAPGPQIDPIAPTGPLEAMRDMPQSIRDIPDPQIRADKMVEWVSENMPHARHDLETMLLEGNLFRGNGFGGDGASFAPELTYGPARVVVPDGAELMRIRPDGAQELAAVYRDGKWHTIVEQPGPAPR